MPLRLSHQHLAPCPLVPLRHSYHQDFLPSIPTVLRNLSNPMPFSPSHRHFTPRWYRAPLCLHRLEDFFLPFIQTFGMAGCSPIDSDTSLSSSLSPCALVQYSALLPFLPSHQGFFSIKLHGGRKHVVCLLRCFSVFIIVLLRSCCGICLDQRARARGGLPSKS
jgi:hypothetical protein